MICRGKLDLPTPTVLFPVKYTNRPTQGVTPHWKWRSLISVDDKIQTIIITLVLSQINLSYVFSLLLIWLTSLGMCGFLGTEASM